ncbi:MAG TPA: hypothetical protein VLB82_07495 [Thermodesulfobacteriota bacterium]|nr:hypothetical protein [Thermodesulfobacteriota bacterium]
MKINVGLILIFLLFGLIIASCDLTDTCGGEFMGVEVHDKEK